MGFDGDKAVAESIRKGRMSGTIAQDPAGTGAMGRQSRGSSCQGRDGHVRRRLQEADQLHRNTNDKDSNRY